MSKTQLDNSYSFWYHIYDLSLIGKTPMNKIEYSNTVKKIADFDNVGDFWKLFQHLRKPETLKNGIELQLFKGNIRPIWEDENNSKGGRISIKLKKEGCSLVWEESILTFISTTMPNDIKNEINGFVMSSRTDFNYMPIWFKTYKNETMTTLEYVLLINIYMYNHIGNISGNYYKYQMMLI